MKSPESGHCALQQSLSMRLLMIAACLVFAPALSFAADADARADRKEALALLNGTANEDCAPQTCTEKARALLFSAARAGDNVALITLERMRLGEEAGAPNAADMVAIEIARAEEGDAMTAWRLAKRYETGDGVAASQSEMIRWLKVAASEEPSVFPYAGDAAYRLCEIYGQSRNIDADQAEARDWCARAANAGHAGAAIVIARLRDNS